MEGPRILFTAVFMKTPGGYVGFIEELPGVNAAGRTVDEARTKLRELVGVVFDEERRATREILGSQKVVRETLVLPGRR